MKLKPTVNQVFYNNVNETLFTGSVRVYDAGRYLYSIPTNIDRLNEADALADAVREINECLDGYNY